MDKRLSRLKAVRDLGRRGIAFASEATWSAVQAYYTRVGLSREEKAILARNAQFRNCYKGKRAFVIGNGPSLKKLDLSLLKNELNFVVNGFWRHPAISLWQPAAIGLIDPFYFTNPDFHAPEFEGLKQHVHSGNFFAPLWAREVIESRDIFPSDRRFYFAPLRNLHETPPSRISVELTGAVPGAQTVPVFMLMLAMYMGCNPIYLIGVDCDFLATPSKATHFYEYDAKVDKDSFVHWSYDTLMRAVLKMWEGYIALREYGKARNIKVLNASAGGFLDVFPRVTFDTLFT